MWVLGEVAGFLCGFWKHTQDFHWVLEGDPGPAGVTASKRIYFGLPLIVDIFTATASQHKTSIFGEAKPIGPKHKEIWIEEAPLRLKEESLQ